MTKTVAIVQARMSSSRFPGKVLEELGGLPMIVFMIERARGAGTLDEVIAATSTDASDNSLADTLSRFGIPCFRGDLDDVLARYAAAAELHRATEIVRLTGDCPLIEPTVIDAVVRACRETASEYASNVEPPTYPDGLDVECFTAAALARATREARLPSEREHVTPWMRSAAAGLRRTNCRAIADLSGLRLTVDYPDDLTAIRAIVTEAAGGGRRFDLYDILRCLSLRPDIQRMNSHGRNEGLARSLASDAAQPGGAVTNR